MEVVKIKRTSLFIGGGSIETPTPFYKGERISHAISPHIRPNGEKHKGNIIVLTVDEIGLTAVARCAMANCLTNILIKATF